STFAGSRSTAHTSWFCASRTALDRPTYPVPATAIFTTRSSRFLDGGPTGRSADPRDERLEPGVEPRPQRPGERVGHVTAPVPVDEDGSYDSGAAVLGAEAVAQVDEGHVPRVPGRRVEVLRQRVRLGAVDAAPRGV